MKKTIYPLAGPITIGYVGENESREIALDIAQMKKTWPDLTPVLMAKRPGENTLYPCVTREEDGALIWKVTRSDTYIAGRGECVVHMVDSKGRVGKSKTMTTVIENSATGEETQEPPEAAKPWVDEVLEAAGEVKKGLSDPYNGMIRYDQKQELTAEQRRQARENIGAGTGGGGGVSFETDKTLTLEDGILRVNTADRMEEDNTLPITSAAVFTEVGNINALLATI